MLREIGIPVEEFVTPLVTQSGGENGE